VRPRKNASSSSWPGVDEALRSEDLDGFSQDSPRNFKLATQIRFIGKDLFRKEVPADDAQAQGVNDVSVEAATVKTGSPGLNDHTIR